MKNQLKEISDTIEEEIRAEFDSDCEQLRRQATDSILSVQQANKRSFDAKRKETRKYKIGDLVSISKTQFATGAKLRPKIFGLYQVTNVKVKGNETERYDVQRVGIHEGPANTNSSSDNMKPWPSIYMME